MVVAGKDVVSELGMSLQTDVNLAIDEPAQAHVGMQSTSRLTTVHDHTVPVILNEGFDRATERPSGPATRDCQSLLAVVDYHGRGGSRGVGQAVGNRWSMGFEGLSSKVCDWQDSRE